MDSGEKKTRGNKAVNFFRAMYTKYITSLVESSHSNKEAEWNDKKRARKSKFRDGAPLEHRMNTHAAKRYKKYTKRQNRKRALKVIIQKKKAKQAI